MVEVVFTALSGPVEHIEMQAIDTCILILIHHSKKVSS
jgi:hypothetical protein